MTTVQELHEIAAGLNTLAAAIEYAEIDTTRLTVFATAAAIWCPTGEAFVDTLRLFGLTVDDIDHDSPHACARLRINDRVRLSIFAEHDQVFTHPTTVESAPLHPALAERLDSGVAL